MRVCVIGAGVSGLATAKTFLGKHHDVLVFEREATLGGVWGRSRAYPGLATQTPGDQYAYSDYPTPFGYRDRPTASEVHQYLAGYATHFRLDSHIRYNSEVTDLRPADGARWTVTVRDAGGTHEHTFDFVAICNGTFSSPRLPELPGMDEFRAAGGQLLHSSAFTDSGLLVGRRLVVVGYGKSAADIAAFAATLGVPVDLIVRRPIWPVPPFFGGVLHVRNVCTSRLWEALMTPLVPPESTLKRQLRKRVLPAYWRAMEALLSTQFGLRRCDLRPEHRLSDQLTSGFVLSPDRFFEHVRSRRIRIHKDTVERLDRRLVLLTGGDEIAADMIVFATGFNQEIPFLDPSVRDRIIDVDGRYHLYKSLVPPDFPSLGFVGYNSSLFTPITSEIGARWLVEFVAGRISTPPSCEMHREIATELELGKAVRPFAGKFTGVAVAPYTYRYLDILLNDLGLEWPTTRLGRLCRYIKPFRPSDFAPVV